MTTEKKTINVTKFTLNSGKVIYLKEPLIADTEQATKLAGMKASPDNQAHLAVLFQKEIVKILLVKINDKVLRLEDKIDLDALFTFKEYGEVSKAIKMVVGDEQGNVELIPELATL